MNLSYTSIVTPHLTILPHFCRRTIFNFYVNLNEFRILEKVSILREYDRDSVTSMISDIYSL